jgi:hypothetical protein
MLRHFAVASQEDAFGFRDFFVFVENFQDGQKFYSLFIGEYLSQECSVLSAHPIG